MHHGLDCAKYRLNPESNWLVKGSFLLTESFCKNYLFSVTSFAMHLCEPFLSDAPHAYFGAPYGAPCTPVEER